LPVDPDFRAGQALRSATVIDALELRDHVFAGALPFLDLDLPEFAVEHERPGRERDDVLARFGVGEDLDPSLDAERARHAPEVDPILRAGVHSAGRSAPVQAAAALRYCLISCATRSVTCAPCETQ